MPAPTKKPKVPKVPSSTLITFPKPAPKGNTSAKRPPTGGTWVKAIKTNNGSIVRVPKPKTPAAGGKKR